MASTTTNDTSTLAAVENSLRQIPKADFSELRSIAKPPLGYLAIFEGIGLLLEPSKQTREWTDDKKLMAQGSDKFLQSLFDFDKNSVTNEQLARLNSILARDDCQPTVLEKSSRLCHQLCLWLRAIVEYTEKRQQAH